MAPACGFEKSMARRRRPKNGFDLQRADNGRWYIHWTEGRRTRRASTRTKDLAKARQVLAKRLPRERAHVPIEHLQQLAKRLDPTCADLWALYMREHVEKKCVTAEWHHYAWKAMSGRFGHLPPKRVTRKVVADHIAARRPAKPSTVRHELRLLTASWNFGVKRRAIVSTDIPILDDLDIPEKPPPRDRWLRETEADRLFAAAMETRNGPRLSRIERFLWLALHTGGRLTALLELQWQQVDFEIRVIHLNPEGRAQTTKSRASVPISDALLEILDRAYAERGNEFVLDYPRRMPGQLAAVAKRAGVEGVTAHVFRHTAATWMARRGVSLWKIAKILGNTVEQVEKVYAKHSPDDLRDAVNLLEGRPKIPNGRHEERTPLDRKV